MEPDGDRDSQSICSHQSPLNCADITDVLGTGPYALITSEAGVRTMATSLFSPHREHPAIGLAPDESTGRLVLTPDCVRRIVGTRPRIYLIDGQWLPALEALLGAKLTLREGATRIWWPGLTTHSDPREHPFVVGLADEPADMAGEFARTFDLSRPLVRQEIALIEDTRRLAEHELAQALALNRRLERRLQEAGS